MSLSADAVKYFEMLGDRGTHDEIFADDVLDKLGGTPDFRSLNAALEKLTSDQRLIVLLRALGTLRAEMLPHLVDAELVVTFPGHDLVSARHTAQVVRQMIDRSTREIVVAGFAITEAAGLIPYLADAALRNVRVILLCSDWKGADNRDAVQHINDDWPTTVPYPVVHRYSSQLGGAGMHMKCLLIDAREILLGSANFTFHGMTRNFEMGVRIEGSIAGAARAVIDEFLNSGKFQAV
jgi:phosphatidylserine/phosphatidylglycerophosphate/cardiolipin synthase-like enzyme